MQSRYCEEQADKEVTELTELCLGEHEWTQVNVNVSVWVEQVNQELKELYVASHAKIGEEDGDALLSVAVRIFPSVASPSFARQTTTTRSS